MTVNDETLPAVVDHRLTALQHLLELADWQIESIDINAVSDRARIELRRGDLRVVFDGDAHSHMIEREVRQWDAGVCVKRYSGRWKMTLLGRKRVAIGWRGGLRLLCNYLANNGTRQLEPAEIRAALDPLMRENTNTTSEVN